MSHIRGEVRDALLSDVVERAVDALHHPETGSESAAVTEQALLLIQLRVVFWRAYHLGARGFCSLRLRRLG